MKKALFLVLLVLNAFALAQENLIPSEDLPEITLTKNKSTPKNEKPAEFPLGTNAFRKLLMQNFRMEMISETSDINCELQFVIDKEGDIVEIKATGNSKEFNDEAANALSLIKQKWIPGTLDGIPVRYRMRVPLDIKFNQGENARFPAGEEAFKKRIIENLKMKNSQEKKSCIISFVVDETGKMNKIGIRGEDRKFNKDVKQSASKIKDRWIPKTIRNISVSSVVEVIFELH
ncbi:energy transducer TonB [Chryseobacterium sp. 2R14A]|uniref:energy transducer TonB n=1 Tax=Chryseobacterium sp. 2R14A TaxID=3380353 RepID=UPI003CF1769D